MRQKLTDSIATVAMVATIPVLIFVMAGAALAAKPNSSSVWINELGVAAPSELGHGDAFTVGYSTRERQPWALVECRPNATTVYSATFADGTVWSEIFSLYPGGPTPQNFVLAESVYPLWTGGGANCTVTLLSLSPDLSRRTVLATADFTAAP
jgi:hypothetical protein